MDNPKSLTDHAYLFIQGKISEEEYVNKHPKNSKKISWEEAPFILRNQALAYQYLSTFKEPGNRRRVLSEAMGINAAKLEYLFKYGSTTTTDLIRATDRGFDPNLLARYAIVHRSTYSMANAVRMNSRWDFHAFDHLGDCTITRELFSQLIMFYVFISGQEEEVITYIKNHFGIRTCYKLTTMYSGS